MKTALKVAAMFHDGQTFKTESGETLDEICMDHNANVEYFRGWKDGQFAGEPVRYLFPDGSAIVETGGAWDVEGTTPYSWESNE